MKKSTHFLMGSALLATYIAFISWFFCLAALDGDYTRMAFPTPLLMVYILLVYYVNFVLAGRGLDMRLYAVVQLVFMAGAVLMLLHFVTLEPRKLSVLIINSVLYAVAVIPAMIMAVGAPKQRSVVLCFDLNLILLALILLLAHIKELLSVGNTVLACAFALALSMLALISARVGKQRTASVRGNPAAGRLLIGLAFAAVAGIAGALAIFASGGAYSFSAWCVRVVKTCAGGVKTALLFVARLIDRFFEWLASFASDVPPEVAPNPVGVAEPGMEVLEGAQADIPTYVYVIIGALAIGAVVFLITRLKGERAQRQRVGGQNQKSVRRESGLKKALKSALARMLAALRYRFYCVQYRQTVPGLVALCEKRAARNFRRDASQSPETFLRALAEKMPGEDDRTCLETLAELAQRNFYGNGKANASRELYRQVRALRFEGLKE